MNTNADVVLITPRSPVNVHGARTPLARFILPSAILEGEMFFPCGNVWWIERHNSHAWLRGCGQVSNVRMEETLDGKLQHLVWELLPHTAERLTQPGMFANRTADVSDLFPGVVSNHRGIQVIPISLEINRALTAQRECLSETISSFDFARRHIIRLMNELHLDSHLSQLNGNLEDAWQFTRTHFARAEIVTLAGWDAFQVGAAALAGLTQMPEIWDTMVAQESDDMVMQFDELDVENILRVERIWVRTSAHSISLDALEQSDRRHQLILKSLATNLRRQGLVPTYNRFVDLRVAFSTHELFFEIKTAHPENFLHQVRLAAGQLLEYSFRCQIQNGKQAMKLIAVVEHNARTSDVEFARQFLASLDISLVLWESSADEFKSLYSPFFAK